MHGGEREPTTGVLLLLLGLRSTLSLHSSTHIPLRRKRNDLGATTTARSSRVVTPQVPPPPPGRGCLLEMEELVDLVVLACLDLVLGRGVPRLCTNPCELDRDQECG